MDLATLHAGCHPSTQHGGPPFIVKVTPTVKRKQWFKFDPSAWLNDAPLRACGLGHDETGGVLWVATIARLREPKPPSVEEDVETTVDFFLHGVGAGERK